MATCWLGFCMFLGFPLSSRFALRCGLPFCMFLGFPLSSRSRWEKARGRVQVPGCRCSGPRTGGSVCVCRVRCDAEVRLDEALSLTEVRALEGSGGKLSVTPSPPSSHVSPSCIVAPGTSAVQLYSFTALHTPDKRTPHKALNSKLKHEGKLGS